MILLISVGSGWVVLQETRKPDMPAPVAIETPSEPAYTFIEPLTLQDIRVSVIRVGTDVTVLLDWDNIETTTPFHIWVEVEGSDLMLHSPNNEPRQIEVVPNEVLIFYGSTLYHELENNRLAIDLQVQTDVKE